MWKRQHSTVLLAPKRVGKNKTAQNIGETAESSSSQTLATHSPQFESANAGQSSIMYLPVGVTIAAAAAAVDARFGSVVHALLRQLPRMQRRRQTLAHAGAQHDRQQVAAAADAV
jgi:hypothetical protein